MREARELLRASKDAQALLQSVAQRIQQQAHKRISKVVTKCLEAVFEDPYEFQIVFERKRGKTEARLIFLRNGNEVYPLTESGGGVADIAALALRLACLILVQPAKRKFLVLDEPFKSLSPEVQELVPELLMTLAKEMKVQILIVTNIPAIQTGKVIRL